MCKSELSREHDLGYDGHKDAERPYTAAIQQQTVRRHIDGEIKKFEGAANALRDLRDNLPQSYLDSPAHRLMALTGAKP